MALDARARKSITCMYILHESRLASAGVLSPEELGTGRGRYEARQVTLRIEERSDGHRHESGRRQL
jgi:hypothetical protein